MELSRDDVQEILELLDAAELDELHLDTGDLTVSFSRTPGGWTTRSQHTREPRVAGEVAAHPAKHNESHVVVEGLTNVHAPLMGTFYRAPSPGADPFVEVGSTVAADSVVGIIETMKLMNSVYAGVAGVVTELVVNNAEYADKDAVLMRIKPA